MTTSVNLLDKTNNIFKIPHDYIVNPVNCIGVMGGGLAKAIYDKYTKECDTFNAKCKAYKIVPNKIYGSPESKIIQFPTKDHVKNPSRYHYICNGMNSLVIWWNYFYKNGSIVKTINIPALGCGLGGLDWNVVKPIVIDYSFNMYNAKVNIFEPH